MGFSRHAAVDALCKTVFGEYTRSCDSLFIGMIPFFFPMLLQSSFAAALVEVIGHLRRGIDPFLEMTSVPSHVQERLLGRQERRQRRDTGPALRRPLLPDVFHYWVKGAPVPYSHGEGTRAAVGNVDDGVEPPPS